MAIRKFSRSSTKSGVKSFDFWDQITVPTVSVEYDANYHIDILCSLGPMLSEEEWKEKGMDKYGLIAQSKNGSAAQVEKVTHATAVKLLSTLV
jgi:hypothetical protein